MPLTWKERENPYRTTWFSLLEVGPAARPGVFPAMRKKLSAKLQHGQSHVVGGREVTEAEIIEAESRLLDERSRAWEVLLVHPVPGLDSKRLQQICRAVVAEATPPPAQQRALHLTNLRGLAALLPLPVPEDIPVPSWEELGIPGPEAPEDRRLDIQLDL